MKTAKQVINHLSTSKELISFNATLLLNVLNLWDKTYTGKLNFFQFGQTIHMCRKTKCTLINKLTSQTATK